MFLWTSTEEKKPNIYNTRRPLSPITSTHNLTYFQFSSEPLLIKSEPNTSLLVRAKWLCHIFVWWKEKKTTFSLSLYLYFYITELCFSVSTWATWRPDFTFFPVICGICMRGPTDIQLIPSRNISSSWCRRSVRHMWHHRENFRQKRHRWSFLYSLEGRTFYFHIITKIRFRTKATIICLKTIWKKNQLSGLNP